jgi:glycosyltransferase involved in cell wall biosynthesis
MKFVMWVPYCPLPTDHGGKNVMLECARLLNELGDVCLLSAATRPVGGGWTPERVTQLEDEGFEIVLRETDIPRRSPLMWCGLAWGALCKGLKLEKAFGHANPYHRWSVPLSWWQTHTADADLVVVAYSFWAHLPTPCPKVLLLLDLWSDTTWTNVRRETRDIGSCDHVLVISTEEETTLNARGISQTLWQPPQVPLSNFPVESAVGLVGSHSAFNREGLSWLAAASDDASVRIRVYGRLAAHAEADVFEAVGRYETDDQPYAECGIMLMTTTLGMGVQVKTIEALAAGRAIIARRGAMRGIPDGEGAWIEVDTPEAMLAEAARLLKDTEARETQGQRAHAYYRQHLDSIRLRSSLKAHLQTLVSQTP